MPISSSDSDSASRRGNQVVGSSRLSQVNRPALLKHLTHLEGERHPYLSRNRLRDAEAYVSAQWRSWNFTVSFDEFSYVNERFVNLIARPADMRPGPRLILGAHLDTVPGSPGADDNASGVAVLLEVARILSEQPLALPIECVAFTLEELGMVASAHYAATLKAARIPVLGMLSLEMVGFTESQGRQHYPWFLRGRFPTIGNYLGLASNHRSRSLLNTVARGMRTVEGLPVETLALPGNGWWLPESRLSDHTPFWDHDYPALLVTDTAFFRNPHYHQPSDTVSTLDLDFLMKVTQGLVAAIETLAERPR